MKTPVFLILCFVSCFCFAQDNHIATLEDGRRILLKADYTWEYIDLKAPEQSNVKAALAETEVKTGKTCSLEADFVEPALDNNLQKQLKRGRATIKHIKKRVAKDYKCDVDDVILLAVTEDRTKGSYVFCANGTRVSYKRMGYSIVEKGKLF
ncbi:DUF3157 family protein [Tamlana fucoidanivorans]|uniref:DUF3157 family protein n=1 Tax=Allotamlana fucoidanivorans TaxID=2583814 RepID=A0A5C4SRV0_9FLAO|nr:DUF3157 family protein [Tamlana fucoidanivorans]TNJ46975.1 DUF3157 family protein [Tamlana fucoidanivorans]